MEIDSLTSPQTRGFQVYKVLTQLAGENKVLNHGSKLLLMLENKPADFNTVSSQLVDISIRRFVLTPQKNMRICLTLKKTGIGYGQLYYRAKVIIHLLQAMIM